MPLSPFRSPSPATASAFSSFGLSAEPVTRPNAVAEFMLYMIPARRTAMRGRAALALRVLRRRARCRRVGGPHSAPRPECQLPRSFSAFCSSCTCSFFSPVGAPADPALSAEAAAGDHSRAASSGADASRVDRGAALSTGGNFDIDTTAVCAGTSRPPARAVPADVATEMADGAARVLARGSASVGVRPAPAAGPGRRPARTPTAATTTRRSIALRDSGVPAAAVDARAPSLAWAV